MNPRETDIEILTQLCKPNYAHVCNNECSQVSLLGWQVPNAIVLCEDLLVRKHYQLFFLNDRTSEFQITVQLSGLIWSDNCLERGKKAGTILDQRRKDKLISALLVSRPQIQGQSIAFNDWIGFFDFGVQNAIEADRQIDTRVDAGEPYQSQVGYQKASAFSIVSFSILYMRDSVDNFLTSSAFKFNLSRVKADLSIVPYELSCGGLACSRLISFKCLHYSSLALIVLLTINNALYKFVINTFNLFFQIIPMGFWGFGVFGFWGCSRTWRWTWVWW